MAKILIVDDEAIFVKIAQVRLEVDGYEVITANDGLEGLITAKREKPDLIILDILMPEMDGHAMLKEVRKNKKIKDIPIIMCSSEAVLNIAEDNLMPKADAYIAKPFDPTVFLAKIEELLKSHKQ